MSRQPATVLGARQPLRRPVAKLHRGNFSTHHLAGEKIALHKIAKRRANAILPRRHNGGMRNRDAHGMTEQRRHGKPIGNAAHHGGFRERPHKAQPRIPRLEESRHHEEHGHPNQHQRGHALHLHQPNALHLIVGGDLQRRRPNRGRTNRRRRSRCCRARHRVWHRRHRVSG